MSQKPFTQKLQALPVPVLPTLVGAATLSNMWAPLGLPLIRHLTMWISLIILICYVTKVVLHSNTVKTEYLTTVPSSLYAGFTMFTMIFGSYIFPSVPWLGKGLWFAGLILHTLHILFFTYYHVFKNFDQKTFVPSWFVTYNGIMVSTVVGVPMGVPVLGKVIVYYGIAILCILLPCLIYRMVKNPIPEGPLYMTKAIVLAPSSLCLVSYFNFIETPNQIVVYALYALVFASVLYVVCMLPKFLSFTFHPGFAALTFPMAIGTVASNRMAGYLTGLGYETFGEVIKQISGVQLYITTGIICFVAFNFFMMFLRSYQPKKA